MWWSRPSLRARLALALLLAPLAGCGFRPMYGAAEREAVSPELAAITVAPIKDRIGQQLELSLREALNPDGLSVKPRFRLDVVLTTSRVDLGIQANATSTRGRVDSYVTLYLSEIETGKRIYTSRAQSTAAFNILTDAYAAEVAEEDARTRTVRDLTTEIRARLSLFMDELRPQQAHSG